MRDNYPQGRSPGIRCFLLPRLPACDANPLHRLEDHPAERLNRPGILSRLRFFPALGIFERSTRQVSCPSQASLASRREHRAWTSVGTLDRGRDPPGEIRAIHSAAPGSHSALQKGTEGNTTGSKVRLSSGVTEHFHWLRILKGFPAVEHVLALGVVRTILVGTRGRDGITSRQGERRSVTRRAISLRRIRRMKPDGDATVVIWSHRYGEGSHASDNSRF